MLMPELFNKTARSEALGGSDSSESIESLNWRIRLGLDSLGFVQIHSVSILLKLVKKLKNSAFHHRF